jgi:F-type H+-transporting ATPase subunit a
MLSQFAAMELHVDIKPGVLFSVGGFDFTNAMFTGMVSLILFFALFGFFAYMTKKGRYNKFIGLMQWAFEGMLGQVYEIIPNKAVAKKVAPLALTIFFYMLVSYWMSIVPGLDTIKVHGVSLIRSLTADLNFTVAVSLIVLAVVQFYAIKVLGPIGNAKRYLRNPFKDPIGAFEGVLEFIGEFSRYAALAVRMFGNCFAGEILLIIVAALTSYLSMAVLPVFMAFEILIGFIQAYVFFVLAVIFTALAIDQSHAHSNEHSTDTDTLVAQTE